MRRLQALNAARLNWYGLMKRAWPDDPEIEERLRFYTALYVQGKLLDDASLAAVAEKYPTAEVAP